MLLRLRPGTKRVVDIIQHDRKVRVTSRGHKARAFLLMATSSEWGANISGLTTQLEVEGAFQIAGRDSKTSAVTTYGSSSRQRGSSSFSSRLSGSQIGTECRDGAIFRTRT